jgi:antitoxin (DNA-binding transcriptional repressor) of toxin-antitoxin stability system
MARKSDKRSERRISATEASRSFSKLLDQVEAGRTFLIRRHDQDVCVMAPPPVRGRKASECLKLLRGRSPVVLDDKFAKDLKAILAAEAREERPSWGS